MLQPVSQRVSTFLWGFRTTYHYAGKRLFVLWGANILAAIVEGFGILLFIPLMLRALPKDPREPALTGLAGMFRGAFENMPIGGLLLAIVVVFSLKGLFVFFVNSYRYRLTNQLRVEVRELLIDGIARLDYRETTKRSSGYFANLVVTEVEGACSALEAYCGALAAFTTAGLLLISAMVLSPQLSITAAVAGGSSLFVLRYFARRAGIGSRQRSRQYEALHRSLNEALGPFKYLKATARFGQLRDEFHRSAVAVRKTQDHLTRLEAARVGFQEPILVCWISFIFFWFGLVKQLNLSVISDSILFFYRTMIELGFMQNHYQRFATGSGSLERVVEAERELHALAEARGDKKFAGLRREIRFERVTFAYDSRVVLNEVSLLVPRLSTVALVGLSGAGKTTLVDLLTGVLRPTGGRVLIDGIPGEEIEPTTFRERIGYVTQDAALFDRTVAQNIEMSWSPEIDEARRERIRSAAKAAGCLDFIAGLPAGFDTLIGERGVRLSGGQRQRLAIARELFREPEILILDEATSSLDSMSENAIRRSLEELHGSLTIVLISHRLSTIRHADRIYLIEEGRVLEEGTFDELHRATGSRFRSLCDLQELVRSEADAVATP